MKLTSSGYEVNFIGLRSYIHRATKLYSFFTPLLSLFECGGPVAWLA